MAAFALPSSGAGGGSAGAQLNTGPNMQQKATAASSGYVWDPVTGSYTRTPQTSGSRVFDYGNAASGGALGAMTKMFGSGGSSIPGLGGSLGTGTGIGAGTGSITGGSVTPGGPGGTAGSVPHVAAPDNSAANTAVFSRAKDQAGALARASLNTLNGEAGALGNIGSGAHEQATRDIIGHGAGALEDVNNQQAITSAGQNADFAKLNYTGDLAQRGQDISQQTAYRGQDIQKSEADAQLALAAQDRYLKQIQTLMSMFGGSMSAPIPSSVY